MKKLKLEISSLDDRELLLANVPQGIVIFSDPDFRRMREAKPPAPASSDSRPRRPPWPAGPLPPSRTLDDAASLVHFIIEFGGDFAKVAGGAVAILKLAEHLGKLRSEKGAKANGVVLPEDLDARRQKLLELMNDPKE